MNEKEMEAKIYNISRGAYWFGIIGRLLVFFGTLSFLFLMASLIPHALNGFKEMDKYPAQLAVSTIQNLIIGYLFIIARDAFESIIYVMKETRDTV